MIDEVLSRPLDQRIREHKYRCAQSIVFGLPVIALQYFGHQLGGAESVRWITIMQIVLTGWILFVAATGMISEGVMVIVARRKITADFLVAIIATAVFLASCTAAGVFFFGSKDWPRLFHIVVILLIVWTGARWARLSAGKSTTRESGSAGGSET